MSENTTKKLRIHNVRFGRATNSSSSHSIVVLPRGATEADQIDSDGSYGWNGFQLATKESKRNYLATQVFLTMREFVPEDIAWHAAAKWVGAIGVPGDHREEMKDDTDLDVGGVDHQSVMLLPLAWPSPYEGRPHPRGIDIEFLRDFSAWIEQENVVICGGNDNTEEDDPPLKEEGKKFEYPIGYSPRVGFDHYLARKDGSYWTLVNVSGGHKIRLSFGDEIAPAAASAPELVDLSITDYCDEGCGFCYRGSTVRGKHAEKSDIEGILWALAELKVFEVAIGGGEPTTHPLFFQLLSRIRRMGMMPNFTTRKLEWLNDFKNVKDVLDAGAAFAFSVHNAEDVHRLSEAIGKTGCEGQLNVSMQHALGSLDNEEGFAELIRAAEETAFPLTLLGYKNTGRGRAFGEKPSSRWLDIIEESNRAKKRYGSWVGIDTVIVERYAEELDKRGVPGILRTRGEGNFSCFINAVSMRLHASSFDGSEGIDLREPNDCSGRPGGTSKKIVQQSFLAAQKAAAEKAR
jgi:hypothetical protein